MDNQESPDEQEINDDKQEVNDDNDIWDDIDNIDENNMDIDNIDSMNNTKPDEFNNNQSSSVWAHFNKNLPDALGYNVCKRCPKKYRLSTEVSSLRKHLKKHQLKALIKK